MEQITIGLSLSELLQQIERAKPALKGLGVEADKLGNSLGDSFGAAATDAEAFNKASVGVARSLEAINKSEATHAEKVKQTIGLQKEVNKLMAQYVAEGKNIDQITTDLNEVNAALSKIGAQKPEIVPNLTPEKTGFFARLRTDAAGFGETIKGSVSSSVKQFGGALAATFSIAIVVDFFKAAVNGAIELEAALSSLQAITGASTADVKEYSAAAGELAIAFGKSNVEIIKSFQTVGSQLPVLLQNKELLIAVTKDILTLSKADPTIGVAGATAAVTGVINQFSVSAQESTRIINILAAASKAGSAEVNQVADSFARFGGVAAANGVSIEESAAAVEVLAEKTLYGAEAGTPLRNIILRLATDADKSLSPAFLNASGKAQGLQGSFAELAKQGRLSTQALKSLFDESNITAAQALAEAVANNKFSDLTAAVTDTNEAFLAADINSKTLGESIAKLKSLVGAFATFVGTLLAPAVKLLVDGFIFLGEKFANLSDFTKTAIISLTAFRVAMVAVNVVMTANPVGAVIAAISVLLILLGQVVAHFDEIKAAGAAAWSSISAGFFGFFNGILLGAKTFVQGFKDIFTGDLVEGFRKILSASSVPYTEAGRAAGSAYKDAFKGELTGIQKEIQDLFSRNVELTAELGLAQTKEEIAALQSQIETNGRLAVKKTVDAIRNEALYGSPDGINLPVKADTKPAIRSLKDLESEITVLKEKRDLLSASDEAGIAAANKDIKQKEAQLKRLRGEEEKTTKSTKDAGAARVAAAKVEADALFKVERDLIERKKQLEAQLLAAQAAAETDPLKRANFERAARTAEIAEIEKGIKKVIAARDFEREVTKKQLEGKTDAEIEALMLAYESRAQLELEQLNKLAQLRLLAQADYDRKITDINIAAIDLQTKLVLDQIAARGDDADLFTDDELKRTSDRLAAQRAGLELDLAFIKDATGAIIKGREQQAIDINSALVAIDKQIEDNATAINKSNVSALSAKLEQEKALNDSRIKLVDDYYDSAGELNKAGQLALLDSDRAFAEARLAIQNSLLSLSDQQLTDLGTSRAAVETAANDIRLTLQNLGIEVQSIVSAAANDERFNLFGLFSVVGTDELAKLSAKQKEAIAGFVSDMQDSISSIGESVVGAINDSLQAEIDKQDALIEASKERVSALQENLDEAKSLYEAGYASQYDTVKGAIEKELRLQEEATKKRTELLRQQAAIEKAAALASIFASEAAAIGSLLKASQGNPLNLLTGGVSGAIQFAAGILQITAAIAQAIAILSSAPTFHSGVGYFDPNVKAPDKGISLRSDEGYAKLQRGERIISARENAANFDLYEGLSRGDGAMFARGLAAVGDMGRLPAFVGNGVNEAGVQSIRAARSYYSHDTLQSIAANTSRALALSEQTNKLLSTELIVIDGVLCRVIKSKNGFKPKIERV